MFGLDNYITGHWGNDYWNGEEFDPPLPELDEEVDELLDNFHAGKEQK
jgi:hypothetical protein